ncbi:hypothetical protein BDV27DRAFT_120281 [Aspergillus caelatus]|uniref:Uncharacterized protein n=1 Tax=Aspergillus caelatus TaxID=61420 RepID=A0A5N7ALF7_9EURO|nr:uncharacterized protein BDV27DRAFT_120281 [Aspergillus caelatus]KAE8369858.1 hypothetical protein BDV27DRAFT_120281 [Aspergillus caelatus]
MSFKSRMRRQVRCPFLQTSVRQSPAVSRCLSGPREAECQPRLCFAWSYLLTLSCPHDNLFVRINGGMGSRRRSGVS